MIMPGLDDDAVRNTGGQVDDLALALIDAAYDKESECRDQLCDALYDLGKRRPALVLSSAYSYLKKHNKLQTGHRVVLLQCMERIIKETLNELDLPLAVDIIKQASMELTVSKEVVPEWQTAASGVLVAMGARFCDEVMDEMLQRFQPGVLPHFFVVQTIGNLSTSNVYGMVPHLTAVLSTMLPMLGMAKHENMRWVFSSALSKFSEAIIDYCANTDHAPDPSITRDRFEQEIGSAFDVLFNSWLQITKEMKLRVAIVEAIGNMCHLMARDKLEEQLPKILQVILGLYKKHPEPIHVTQGLCSVLDAVCIKDNTVLEPHLDTVLSFLFPQIINPPDYKNPQSIKNQNEVLRCLAIIARSFSGKLTGILLTKLESGNEKMKIGMLTVFKHLINAAAESMEDKQEVVVSGLKMMLNEQNNKLKKVFAQVIIAMAHHGYLELEGGQQMMEFIVKQCALKDEPPGKKNPDPEYVTNQALRMMCDHVLQLLTTTVEDMESVLWPYLLELIVPEQYTEAQGLVCKCLSHIATKKRKEQAEDYEIDYETQANIPKAEALIARLMVLAGRPQNGRNRGIHVLTLMQALVPNLNDQLVELWDTVIPKLVQYLEDAEKEDTWNQKNWEDLSLKLLSKSLDVVDNEEWIASLGEVFGQQIPLYNSYPEEKNFLYKCLGVITRKSTKKDFVGKHLDLIFSTVKHTDQTEREGCAIAMGFCAASHLDAVLSKLESVAKTELQQKSSGLFSFMKGEKSEVDVERTKATLMLCYGFVALFSPVSLIVSRMEATILRSIQPYFANVKDALNLDLRRCLIRTIELIGKAFDPRIMKKSHTFIPKQKFLNSLKDTSVKQNLIRTLDLIGDALHPDHLKTTYNFSNRGEFINHLQTYMQMESTASLSNETRALAMNACTTLVLDPRLSEAEELDLIRTSIDCVYPLPPGGLATKKNKEESYDKTIEIEVLMQATFDALHDLLKELLLKDLTPNGLYSIFKQLSKWFLSLEDHERERALTTLLIVEQFLLENMEPSSSGITDFPNECVILAKLIPRCTDPSIKVRQLAMDCVQCTLKIASRISGNSLDQPDQMIDALTTLKDRLEKEDSTVLFSVINDLAKVVAKKLPGGQLVEFLETLQEGLLDPQSHSSSGACVVLNGMMKARGGEVSKHVSTIIKYLHDKLEQIEFEQTRTGTLRSIRTLASHHLTNVLKALLSYPLPYDSNIVAIWQILSQDSLLTSGMVDQLLDMLQRQLPYEEKTEGEKITKTATLQPLAVTCAFKIIFDVEETEEVLIKNYHRLFSALMLRIGSSLTCKPPKQAVQEEKEKPKDKKKNVAPPSSKVPVPSLAAVETFKSFLQRSKSDDVVEGLDKEDCWEMFEDEERYPDSITTLCRKLIESEIGKSQISKIVTSVASGLSSLYDPQRVTVAAFFSELINLKCAGNDDMIEMIMNSLLGRLVDSSHLVRMLCIRGLGNVASNDKAQVQQYSTTVLSAMMAGMDDKEDPEDLITTEAMSGLSKILSEIDESHIRAILINVSLRIRPCFEKDRPTVRAQAFILFGNLSRFGDGPSKAPFLEQIHSNFVSLLLHLNDPEPEVKKACKFSLRLLGPLLESKAINDKFQKYLLEDANLIYGEFMNDLAKCIIQDFPDKVNFYVMGCLSFYKSLWAEIKCNAALFTGYLLGNLSSEKQGSISKEHVCSALIILLKDPSASVRAAAAEAMSLLYEY